MTTLISIDARYLLIVNFADSSYYVAWLDAAGPAAGEALRALDRHAD
jgi:hypothetical protein